MFVEAGLVFLNICGGGDFDPGDGDSILECILDVFGYATFYYF